MSEISDSMELYLGTLLLHRQKLGLIRRRQKLGLIRSEMHQQKAVQVPEILNFSGVLLSKNQAEA